MTIEDDEITLLQRFIRAVRSTDKESVNDFVIALIKELVDTKRKLDKAEAELMAKNTKSDT